MPKRKSSTDSARRRSRRPAKEGQDERYWLYGFHAVAAALANPNRTCHHLLATTAAVASDAVAPFLERDGLIVEIGQRDDIAGHLPPGAVHQGLALACDPLPDAQLDVAIGRPGPIVVLDQATDPRNVGAVMRSAAALGAAALVVPRRHGPPASGALAKAASGALETLPIARVSNLVRTLARLQEAGYWCVGFDAAAERSLDDANLIGKTALIMGAEGSGLRRLTREACDDVVRIPMADAETSLNLSAAAAIALFAASRGSS
jgi:23S rRNA (guanosine2251-2'-O)-methyltransferase